MFFKSSLGWRIHTNRREILISRNSTQELRFITQSRPQVTIKWAITFYGLSYISGWFLTNALIKKDKVLKI